LDNPTLGYSSSRKGRLACRSVTSLSRRPCRHPVRRWRIEALLSVQGRRLVVVNAIKSDDVFERGRTEIRTSLCVLYGKRAGAYKVLDADTAS
jgi:predicted site-specific integrase-resolvase